MGNVTPAPRTGVTGNKLKTGKYRVRNTTSKPVHRIGVTFPAAPRGKDKGDPVTVEAKTRAQHLQLRACRALDVQPAK